MERSLPFSQQIHSLRIPHMPPTDTACPAVAREQSRLQNPEGVGDLSVTAHCLPEARVTSVSPSGPQMSSSLIWRCLAT